MVDSVTSSFFGSSSQSAAAQAAEAGEDISADFDEFLNLLTVQLRNQDPLNPQDSTQFVEQLATFSGVEQQVGTNTRLDQLITAQSGSAFSEISGFIGQTVSATNPLFEFDGVSLELTVPEEERADRASVVITDIEGETVATIPAPTNGGSVVFDGVRDDGGRALPGEFLVEFVYEIGEGPNAATLREPAQANGEVVEARIENGVTLLRLANDALVTPENVFAVTQAPLGVPTDEI